MATDEPFMSIATFTTEYQGTLTAGEKLQATRLLTGVSDDIREKRPDVDANKAAQVVFEVVRDAIAYGDLEKFSTFLNTTSRRTQSGTFTDAALALDDYLNIRQQRFLGLKAAYPTPRYTFGD